MAIIPKDIAYSLPGSQEGFASSIKEPAELSRTDSRFLASLYQQCPELLTMQQHLTAFMALVRQQDRHALDTWLSEAEQTGLPDLLGFVQGLRRDYAAVAGALEYAWSHEHVA